MRKYFWILVLTLITGLPVLSHAGQVELTTYYPAPDGEYKDLRAKESLTVPVKDVNGDTDKVNAGEIWVEQED